MSILPVTNYAVSKDGLNIIYYNIAMTKTYLRVRIMKKMYVLIVEKKLANTQLDVNLVRPNCNQTKDLIKILLCLL